MEIPDPIQEMILGASATCITGAVSLGVRFLYNISCSIQELNVKLGKVIDRQDNQEDRIEDHEERLRVVEHTPPRKGR